MLESLMGLTVLAAIVLAVGSAVSAGRSQSVEGQKAVLGVMAADDLLSEISTQEYSKLAGYDGMEQAPGEMASLAGLAYPGTYWQVGRRVSVEEQTLEVEDLGVNVRGMRVMVSAFDEKRTLAELEAFLAEPAP